MSRSDAHHVLDENERKAIAYDENSKSILVAYLLWFLFGMVGAHRFYMGNTKGGVIGLLLWLIPVLGWLAIALWWLVDAFRIPDAINEHNIKITNMLNYGHPDGPQEFVDEEKSEVRTELDSKRQAMLDDLRSTGYRKERPDYSSLYR